MAVEKEELSAAAAASSSTSVEDVEVMSESVNEKRLLRTLDLRLLPAVSILYLLSFLDRSNSKWGQAIDLVSGWRADLK